MRSGFVAQERPIARISSDAGRLLGSFLCLSLLALLGTGCPAGMQLPRGEPPTADAGPDQIVQNTLTVALNGSGSDPDGGEVTFAWRQVAEDRTGTFTNANRATTQFTASSAGTYTFELTVTDEEGAVATDRTTVIFNPVVVE